MLKRGRVVSAFATGAQIWCLLVAASPAFIAFRGQSSNGLEYVRFGIVDSVLPCL